MTPFPKAARDEAVPPRKASGLIPVLRGCRLVGAPVLVVGLHVRFVR